MFRQGSCDIVFVLPFVKFGKFFSFIVLDIVADLLGGGVHDCETKLAAELRVAHAGAVVVGVGDCVVIIVKEDSGINNLL